MPSFPSRRNSSRLIVLVTALLLAGAGFGCNGGPTAPDAETPGEVRTPVARVELSRTELTLGVGDSAQVEAIARSSAGESLGGRPIEWSSSNSAVASVSATGLLRAIAPGAAMITAVSEGQRGTLEVSVLPAPAVRVVLAPSATPPRVEWLSDVTVAVLDATGARVASPNLSARSSDTTVATIATLVPDGRLMVAGMAEGTATITVRATNPAGLTPAFVEGNLLLTFGPAAVGRVELTPGTASIATGDSVRLTAATFSGSGRPITGRATSWRSTDEAIARVSQAGWVRGIAAGTATIIVDVEGRSDSTALTVTPGSGEVPVGRITVKLDRAILPVLHTTAAVATLYDSAGRELPMRDLHWRSSDERIATVREDGVIAAVSPGTVTISATSGAVTGSATLVVLPFDSSPPEIVGVSLTPAVVDVTAAPATVTARVQLRDEGAGIDSNRTVIGISTPRSLATCSASTLVSGTRNDGTWECTIRLPQGARPGQWAVSILATQDLAFNPSTLSAGDIAGLGVGVTVTNANADVTPPTINSVSFSPPTVDITGHSTTTTIIVAASDAGSGVDLWNYKSVEIESPAGERASCNLGTLVSGTAQNGSWSCVLAIPQWSRVGEWVVRSLVMTDADGNARVLDAAALRALPAATLTVTGPAPDVTPPSLVSITLAPTTVQKGASGAVVTATFAVTDDLRGLDNFRSTVALRSPSGNDIHFCGVPQLVSGTGTNGTWRCNITIDPTAELGTWTLDQVTLTDIVGNRRQWLGAEARAFVPGGIVVQP